MTSLQGSDRHVETDAPARAVESRLRSVVAYLRELHALRFPPVRNVRSYNDLLLDESKVTNAVPGVRFDPRGPAWLTVDLPSPPPEKSPPADVAQALIPRLIPLSPPVLRTDLELPPNEREEVTRKYRQWMASQWEPWQEEYRRYELGRQLYLELFSAHDRLDADRNSLELVWGFGRVRWKTGDIDHPLVVAPMEINYDAGAARLDVIQSGTVQVTTGFLAGIPLVAPAQFNDACESLEKSEIDPWEPDFVGQQLAPLLRMMSNDPPTGGGPSLDDEWLLFIRRRPSGYLEFLQSLDSKLESLAGLPSLATLVSADPHQVEPLDRQGSTPISNLLPLPANEEQRQILRFANSSAGVAVEGPPGTGKSHTIANLVCAFLAQGKRVLVTAEREQALNVLIEKLPEAVKPLCVPVLGSGVQERQQLRDSIDRILKSAFGIAEYNAADILRFEAELDEIRRTEAAALNELRRQREVESAQLPKQTPTEVGGTLAELAAWLRRKEPELGYIPDPVTLDAECPLSPPEFVQLASLLGDISEGDMTAALLPLPETEKLPDSAVLIATASERRDLEAILDEHHAQLYISQTAGGAAGLHDLEKQLHSGADKLRCWAGTWQGRLELAARDDAVLRMWRSFAEQLTRGHDSVMALRAQVQSHDIELPQSGAFDYDATAALRSAHERLRKKGSLGIWERCGRRILEQCRVDGQIPRTAEHVELVLAASELFRSRLLLANILNSEHAALDLTAEISDRPEDIVTTLIPKLEAVLKWRSSTWPELLRRALAAGCKESVTPDPEELNRLAEIIRAVAAGLRLRELDDERRTLVTNLTAVPDPNHSPLWEELTEALDSENWLVWGRTREEVLRLNGLAVHANRLRTLLDRIAASAPQWAASARTTGGASLHSWSQVDEGWRWRQLATWFEETTAGPDPAELEDELRRLAERRSHVVSELVAAQAWTAVAKCIDGPTQVALGAYKRASALAGQRFSKFAPMYQAQVRAALNECRHAIPVWIMPVEKALTDFRCESKPPFDVLIVDEASQIPVTRVPLLGLAERVIVVGDDKQMSPSTPGLELQPIFDLIRARLANVPKADTTFHPNASLYDAALTHFPRQVKLTEHFRCLTEIIRFSNSRYYGDALVPLRDQLPSPGWVPTHSVLVSDGYRDDDDCNRPEAEYIAALIASLIKRPEYARKTLGVISLLGKNQSKLIHDLLFDRLGPVLMAERRIRVGEPAVLQGDERDIVVISTVVSDSGGRRFGAMTRRDHQQMVNVAASRARDQMWVIHSVPDDAFSRNDERAALIRHCTQVRDASATFERLAELVDARSPFERDVLRVLIDRGYRTIRPQYRVGRYQIDFVVEGPHSRLAIECDGERFHGPEKWNEDRARQEVLERAGWTFVRVRGSRFYRNSAQSLQPVWEKLDELGIPTGQWRVPPGKAEIEIELRRAKRKIEEAPAGTVLHKEMESSNRTNESPGDSARNPGGDPWGAAFSAADKALRVRAQSTESPDDQSTD